MLDVNQVAALLGVKPNLVYRRYRTWGLRAYKIGGATRFDRADVEAFKASCRVM